MNNLILSLSFCYHDSAVTIADQKEVLLHLEAERFFRKKHISIETHEDVEALVSAALDNLGCSIEDVDELLITKWKNLYRKNKTVILLGKEFTPIITSHHQNHIGTMVPSKFQEAIVVCADGGSEDGTTKIYHKKGNKYTLLEDLDDTPMTGKFYGSVTQIVIHPDHRLAHNTFAGKLMGLSALGCLNLELLNLIQKHLDMLNQYHENGAEDLLRTFKISDDYSHPWLDKRRIDMAFTAHNYWVDTFANHLKKYSPLSQNIALVGGCALNIALNSKLIDEQIFKNVYVSPVSTDAGQSLGAILYRYPHISCTYPFLGRHFGEIEEPFDISTVLQYLISGNIIAWYQGRAEIGARALGHRSFIGLPFSLEQKEKISVKIKKREGYRPVAAIVPREFVSDYFYQTYDSPFMTFCAKAKPITKKQAPAIVHFDDTTRVQTLTQADNPVLYKILIALKEKGYPPILMNTSFNVNGEPIVDTPKDAICSFKNSGASVLFINGVLFKEG